MMHKQIARSSTEVALSIAVKLTATDTNQIRNISISFGGVSKTILLGAETRKCLTGKYVLFCDIIRCIQNQIVHLNTFL